MSFTPLEDACNKKFQITESMAFVPERRRRVRAEVEWPVRFHPRNPLRSFDVLTKNVSSDGFYCLLDQPFSPGQAVDCVLFVPIHDPGRREDTLVLCCQVRAVHVDILEGGTRYGVGFHIDHYAVERPVQAESCAADAAPSLLAASFWTRIP